MLAIPWPAQCAGINASEGCVPAQMFACLLPGSYAVKEVL